MEVILRILFLFFSNIDIWFSIKKLIWKLYRTIEALLTTNWVKLFDKREFTKAALDKNSKTFIIYISALDIKSLLYPSRATQIATLLWDKAFIEFLAKYTDYIDIFSLDLIIELLKNVDINKYIIKLVEEKQPPYRFI